jgi:hypothetical protein
MRTYVVIFISLLVLPLVSCTRAAKDSKASVSIELPQSAATAANMRLAHVAINVTGSGINPAIVYTWDNNQNGAASATTPEVFQVAEIPSGTDRLFQVLAVYKNIDTSQMVFYYGDVTKSLEGSEISLDVAISQVGAGNVTGGRVSGRYFDTPTTGPTSLIDVKYNPGNGKPALIVDQGSIINGWFSTFMLSGANLQYVLRNSGTMLWGQEMSLEAASLNPAENAGAYFDQRVRAFIPVHIRTQTQNSTTTYLPSDAETYVWGYWGPGATGKKVCTSGLDSSPTPTKIKRFTTTNLAGATAFTVSHVSNYSEPIPTKAELTNKASPYTTIVVQGGANMSSSCGGFADNATNQYANFQKVYLDLFDGNGGDSVAGFRGLFRGTVVSNGSPTFVTVSSGDPRVLTGQALPGVVDVFNKVRLFKRATSEEYNMDTANCHDLASKNFLPGSVTDGTIDSSGNFSLSSTISAAEATSGVSAVVCPIDPAGNVAQMGLFLGKWMFSSSGGGSSSGGPATQIAVMKTSSPTNMAATYQCFDITVMMKDANGVQASPSTSPINYSISTVNPTSGISYYNTYADCNGYVNALSPGSLVMPANQSSMQLYIKSNTNGSGFVVTPASAGLTSVSHTMNLDSTGNYVKLDFPQSMLAGLCYKGKAGYFYLSGSSSYAGSDITVALTSSSSIGFYSDASCSTSTSSVVINSGYTEADLYVKVTGTGSTPLTATSTASGVLTADHRFYSGSGTSTVASTSMIGPTTVSTGGCTGPYEVSLQNASGTTVPASSTKSITLNSTLSTTFYSDNSCTSSTSTVNISSGAYKSQVWAKFNAAGINSLSGASGGLTASGYPVTVNGLQKFDLLVEGSATSGNHGQCIRLEIQPTNYPTGPGSFPYDPVTLNFVNFPANSLFKNRINTECVGALGGTSITMPSYAPTPQYVYFLAMNSTSSSLNLISSNMHLEASNYASGTALNFTVSAAPTAVLADGASGNAAVEFPFKIIDILERFTGIPSFVTSYFNGTSWVTASQFTLTDSVANTARVTDSTSVQVNYSVVGKLASWTASFLSGTMPNYFSITRPSQGYQVLSNGYLSLAASHIPRWDRDPDPAGAHPIRGLLVEGPMTNLLGSGNISEDLTLWDVNPGGNGYAQVTRDNSISITDLTGTNNPMWRLMDTNGGNASNVERAVIIFTNDIADNQDFVASVFIKKDTSRYAGLMLQSNGGMSGGVVIDLDNGTTAPMTGPYTPQEVLASGAEKFNNGWYRVWVKFNSHVGTHGMFYLFPAFCDTNAATICQNGLISATGNVFVWGGQVEQSSSLTSYMPTSAGARAAEDLTIPLSNITSFSASEGTFRAEFASAGTSFGKSILHVGDATNSIDMFGDPSNGKISGLVTAGSVAQGVTQSALPFAPNGSANTASFSYLAGTNVKLNLGVNGLGSTSGNITTVSAPSLSGLSLQVGGINAQPASYVNGSIKAIHYWPYAFGVPGVMSCTK